MIVLQPPVTPDAETARRWAEDELAKSEYSEGGGNWLMDAIDWLLRVFTDIAEGTTNALGTAGTAVVIIVVVGVLGLIAWVLVGPLRRSRRAASTGDLFEDERPASALAEDARRAAAAGDWAGATAELYRALIRLLAERELMTLTPGVTAHEAAVAAGQAVPALATALLVDADAFDRIRYGDGWGDQAAYDHVQETYRVARSARRAVLDGATAESSR